LAALSRAAEPGKETYANVFSNSEWIISINQLLNEWDNVINADNSLRRSRIVFGVNDREIRRN